MDPRKDYIEINRKLWNEKTTHHVESEFYDMESFMSGKTSLKTPELELLGDLKDKTIVHLQCHFGQDTLSLARMGAKVTGVDLSDVSIDYAERLADTMRLPASFIRSDIYDVPNVLNEQFDMVFNTYGVVGWHPDMKAWAKVVSGLLKSGGVMILAEFHPVVWMFDNKFTKFEYPYFNQAPIVETNEGTYADKDAEISLKEVGWNHSLSDVIQSLTDEGLVLEVFREYDWSPYDCFNNTIKVDEGKWQIKGMEGKIPMMYSLRMRKQ